MEDRNAKTETVLLVVLAWLIALALIYLVLMKIRLLNAA